MVEKLLKWLLFSVIVSIVPLFSIYIILHLNSTNPSLISLISRGELQLISVALLANGIGEIVASNSVKKIFQILLAGLSTVLLLIISIWYGAIANILISGKAANSSMEYPTLITFIIAFFVSGLCILAGDNEK